MNVPRSIRLHTRALRKGEDERQSAALPQLPRPSVAQDSARYFLFTFKFSEESLRAETTRLKRRKIELEVRRVYRRIRYVSRFSNNKRRYG